jgi:hypothetical protein
MSYRNLLILLGVVLIGLGLAERGWVLVLVWLGVDFVALGIAHGRGAHKVYGKRADGRLAWWSWVVFLPLLIYATLVWQALRLFRPEPACSVVNEKLVIGRRLMGSEFESGFDNMVDLTAEFAEPRVIRRSPGYRSFPILDGAAPRPEDLRAAVAGLRAGRTFVHCAQGHGRSALFGLAMLLGSGEARSVEEGLRKLAEVRPGVRLNRRQRRCIEEYARRIRIPGNQ